MAVVTPPSAVLVQELRKKFNQKLEKEGTKVQGKITINSLKIILSQVCHSLYIYIYSAQSQILIICCSAAFIERNTKFNYHIFFYGCMTSLIMIIKSQTKKEKLSSKKYSSLNRI